MRNTSNIRQLYNELQTVKNMLSNSTSYEEKIALLNYISDLNYAIKVVSERKIFLTKREEFGSVKNYNKLMKRINISLEQATDAYINDIEIHRAYLNEILQKQEDIIGDNPYNSSYIDMRISENEFFEIFYNFMKSINQESLFERYLKENRIFKCYTKTKEVGAKAFLIANPITKDCNVFIHGEEYTINFLISLAHEFGHVYDISNFKGTMRDFNNYRFQSFNAETIPKLFERLMIDYLINNDIYLEVSMSRLKETMDDNQLDTLDAYILSLLDAKYLYGEKYKTLKPKQILSLIRKEFTNLDLIKDHLKYQVSTFDILNTNGYGYGGILSLFMKDSVEKQGLESPLLKKFMDIRHEQFCESFIHDNHLTSKKYGKYLRKELEQLKK